MVGGAHRLPLQEARGLVRDGLADLAAEAADRDVLLALEPMHPMMARARSALTSLAEANDLVADLPGVALAYDAYHLWWDARLGEETARAAGRIAAVQVADWIDVPDGVLDSRGFPGEGCIDFDQVLGFADRAGYDGPIEIEVLSKRWQLAGPDAAFAALERSLEHLGSFTPSTA